MDLPPRQSSPRREWEWEQIFFHTSLGIRIGSADGRTLEAVNPAFAQMHGYSIEEMRQMPVEQLYPPELRESLPEIWRRATEDGHYAFESWHVRKDGSRFPVSVQISVIRDSAGQAVAQAVYVQDITQRHQAEVARAASEDRYRVIAEAASDALITIDGESRVLLANRAVQRIFGYSPEELIGESLTLIMPEYLRHVHRAALLRYLDTGVRHLNWAGIELPGLHRDGHEVPLEVSFGESSGPEGHTFSAILRDISERKAAEAALRRSEQELLQAQKMEAVGRLAGGIAHDSNNLVTVLSAAVHYLLQRHGEGDPDHAELLTIQYVAQRAASLNDQLMAFSRRQVLQAVELDLNQVVRRSEALLLRLVGGNVQIALRLDGAASAVRADPTQLEQVLLNLAINARDAMPGGGTIQIETSNVTVNGDYASTHLGLEPGPYVMLAVTDSGHGMDPLTKSQIFEPFFTTKEAGKGTGLGLATVYGIVKQSGGSIYVYSEPGHGSTFKIYLPAIGATEHSVEQPGAAGPTSQRNEVVLLAEDQPDVRRFTARVLRERGYQVLEAESGEAALALVRDHPGPLHLLLTDSIMPGMSGRVLAERLRAARPGLRVVFMSGYTDDAVLARSVVDSGVIFLQKPFTPASLAAVIQSALDAGPSARSTPTAS